MSSFFRSMDISASALTAQRLRMDVIASNIANANTTRKADGQPYRRQYVTFASREDSVSFDSVFSGARGDAIMTERNAMLGNGVRVTNVIEDTSPFKLDFNPQHPDADEDGYVSMPNVDTAVEMTDMMVAVRAYESNITASNAFKNIAMKALEIGKI